MSMSEVQEHCLPCFEYRRSACDTSSKTDSNFSGVKNGLQLINGIREENGSVQSEVPYVETQVIFKLQDVYFFYKIVSHPSYLCSIV
jgi:hypothetical protein